ncbi:hypothetical protein T484DRAFT_1887058 [Baffinella frigidus]|nr:hypothetical protein T484DRAFT_1887058 [Cryptophyta sp. CCMP2293]
MCRRVNQRSSCGAQPSENTSVSQGDDDSFYGLMARLNSTRDLHAGCSRCPTTTSTPQTPSHFEKKKKSTADRSTTPSPPRTPQRFQRGVLSKETSRLERVIHHIWREPSPEFSPLASSAEFSRLETYFERTNHVSRVGAAYSAGSSPAATNSPKTPSHVKGTNPPRDGVGHWSVTNSPKYMLSPPPSPALPERLDSSGHRDSAVFLARMHRGLAPSPLARVRSGMESWAAAPQAKGATSSLKHTVKNMQGVMRRWSFSLPREEDHLARADE